MPGSVTQQGDDARQYGEPNKHWVRTMPTVRMRAQCMALWAELSIAKRMRNNSLTWARLEATGTSAFFRVLSDVNCLNSFRLTSRFTSWQQCDLFVLCNPVYLDAVMNLSAALQWTAEDFLESLDHTPGLALAELMSHILCACGCNDSVDADEVLDYDGVVDALDNFTEGAKKVRVVLDSVEYKYELRNK